MLKNEHILFNIHVLTDIIDSYSIEYVLKQFFNDNIDKINWDMLSTNPNAIDYLYSFPDKLIMVH